MDAIVSGVHGKSGFLVLIERKTCFYLIVKLHAITQQEVLRAFCYLFQQGKITKILLLTTDDSSDFLDSEALVNLFTGKVYYTHIYAAREKGPVENVNRLVRRWCPKGTDFSKSASPI